MDFYRVEHERWMAFTRVNGWRLATTEAGAGSVDDVLKCMDSYKEQFIKQNTFLRLHPALVLDLVEDLLMSDLEKLDNKKGLIFIENDKPS